MNRNICSVTQINRYIKSLLEEDYVLQNVWIEGELSNFKLHSSGHMYFTLKDSGAAIQCIMFRSYAEQLPFVPKSGMKVLCCGRISLYDKTGQYQLYAEGMEPAGTGGLYAAFEQLKEMLAAEGLFDMQYKKRIPTYPKCIAIITSPTGAALRDIIHVVKRRNKAIALVVVPVLVQGGNAAADIARALKAVNAWGVPDLIIVGRGGGPLEDLWAFNEEAVARAVFASKIPIISAVGHETDYTITDFVADLRAPTPSAAAEMAAPSLVDIQYRLQQMNAKLQYEMHYQLKQSTVRYQSTISRRAFLHPQEHVYSNQVYLTELTKKLIREMDHQFEKNRMLLSAKITALENVSPLAVLKRGYAVVYKEKRARAASASDLHEGENITIRFFDGEAAARVL